MLVVNFGGDLNCLVKLFNVLGGKAEVLLVVRRWCWVSISLLGCLDNCNNNYDQVKFFNCKESLEPGGEEASELVGCSPPEKR